MRPLFVDTSGWIALYDPNDTDHWLASEFWESLAKEPVRLYTTHYVLDETYTLLRRRAGLHAAIVLHDLVEESKVVQILEVDVAIREAAWQLFTKYTDKVLSFTDCTSFAIMHPLKIQEAFALDDDFAQVGFVCLPYRG